MDHPAKRFLTCAGGGAGCRTVGPSHRMISRSLSRKGEVPPEVEWIGSRPVRLHREFGFENAGGVSKSGCVKGEIRADRRSLDPVEELAFVATGCERLGAWAAQKGR
jgi:hypothetical protein